MSDFSLYMGPEQIEETIKAADDSFQLPTPEQNPTVKQGKKEGHGTWTEVLKIVDSSESAPKGDPGSKTKRVFKLVCEPLGPQEGGYEGNLGKVFYYNCYIEKDKLFDKSHKQYRQMARRIAVMNSLIYAVGGDPSQGVDYAELFAGKDDHKPFLGLTVQAVIKKDEYTKTGELAPTPTMDVVGFLAAS